MPCIVLAGCDSEHRSQHRTDTGCPAETERDPGDRRGERAESLQPRMEPLLLVQPRGLQEQRAEDDQGEVQDEQARHPGDDRLVGLQRMADRGGGETEADEHGGEPSDEQTGVAVDPQQQPVISTREVPDIQAGDDRQGTPERSAARSLDRRPHENGNLGDRARVALRPLPILLVSRLASHLARRNRLWSAQGRTAVGARDGLLWSRPKRALLLMARAATVRTCGPVAVLVGTILTAVNQGGTLLHGRAGAADVARIAAKLRHPLLRLELRPPGAQSSREGQAVTASGPSDAGEQQHRGLLAGLGCAGFVRLAVVLAALVPQSGSS